VSQATGQPIFNPPVPQQVMQAYHPHAQQMQTVPSQTYPSAAIRMYQHEAQPQSHITSYLVPTPPSTTPSPGQPHQQAFHPGPQPSPAAGPPAQAFQPQGQPQYVMFMPGYAPQFVNSNQQNQPHLQVVMPPQQQHPTQ
jgi:ataxin 2/2L